MDFLTFRRDTIEESLTVVKVVFVVDASLLMSIDVVAREDVLG